MPKSVIPSYYGIIPSGTSKKQLFGDNSIHTPLPNISIGNPMSLDGTVEDWDTATNLWEYAITSRLTNARPGNPMTNGLNDKPNGDVDVNMEGVEDQEKPLEENPLLMTETGWNSGKNREKGIEIAMENWGCPAYWLARNGVLAACASGLQPHEPQLRANSPSFQIFRRQTLCPCSRHWRRQHLDNPRPRRPHPEKRRCTLPTSRKLHLLPTPPPFLHLPTANPPDPALPHNIQNPCRRRRAIPSHVPHLSAKHRPAPLFPPFRRRAHPDRIQRIRRPSLGQYLRPPRPARHTPPRSRPEHSWAPVRNARWLEPNVWRRALSCRGGYLRCQNGLDRSQQPRSSDGPDSACPDPVVAVPSRYRRPPAPARKRCGHRRLIAAVQFLRPAATRTWGIVSRAPAPYHCTRQYCGEEVCELDRRQYSGEFGHFSPGEFSFVFSRIMQNSGVSGPQKGC